MVEVVDLKHVYIEEGSEVTEEDSNQAKRGR